VNGIAKFGAGCVQERVKTSDAPIYKPGCFEGRLCPREIVAPDEDVNVLRVANGGLIHRRDPRAYGIPPDYRVLQSGTLKNAARTQESLANHFHGIHHPLQNDVGTWERLRHGQSYADHCAFLPSTFAMSKSMKSAWWKIQDSMVRSTLSPSWEWVATMCMTSGGMPCL